MLKLHNDPEGIHKPLVLSWWQGKGFVDLCPSCTGWVRFTTLRMADLDDEGARSIPHLPSKWADVAQIA